MKSSLEVETELGVERLCSGCKEYWPKDETFWYFDSKGRVLGRCRACWSERTRDSNGVPHFNNDLRFA